MHFILKAKNKNEAIEKEEQVATSEKSMNNGNVNTISKKVVQNERKSIFDKWSDKLKDFLDNAE